MTSLTVNVVGTPAPQGSKKGFLNPRTGRVAVVDDNKKPLRSWRQDVKASALDQLGGGINLVDALDPMTGPVNVEVTFYMARPGYHFGTGRNAGVLKPSAPRHVDKKPDLDKLLRSTLDGLKEAGVYRDDAQVARVTTSKLYADAATGARITITPLDPTCSVPAVVDPAGAAHTSDARRSQGEGSGERPTPTREGALF